MEKKSRIGLLEQFEIACVRPGRYNELLKNKPARRGLYLLILALLLVIVEYAIPFVAWDSSVGGIENFMLNKIPQFTLSNKGLDISTPVNMGEEGVWRVKVNSSKNSYNAADFDEEYQIEVLISKSNVMIKSLSSLREIKFSSLEEFKITNKTLVSLMLAIRAVLAVYIVFLLLASAISYMIWCLIYSLICRRIVRTKAGKVVSQQEAFACSFYARTVPALLFSINYCLNGIVDSVILTVISVFLTIGFMRRAEMSVLSDGENGR